MDFEIEFSAFYDSFLKLLGSKKLSLILWKYGRVLVTFTTILYIHQKLYAGLEMLSKTVMHLTLQVFLSVLGIAGMFGWAFFS